MIWKPSLMIQLPPRAPAAWPIMPRYTPQLHNVRSIPSARIAEVHQFLKDADPKGWWCIWLVHECMVQGWSRGVLYRGAAQFTLRWNAQNTSKQLDEIHKTLQSNSPIPKYIYIQLYTHRFLVTHLLLRFHKSAEEKMKTATYVSNPQRVWNANV